MRKRWIFVCILLIVLVFLLPFICSAVTAAPNDDHKMNWWTVDGGGGESQGRGYTLKCTIGQHDAGFLQGGEYVLQGGFWYRGILEILEFFIHLPLVLR